MRKSNIQEILGYTELNDQVEIEIHGDNIRLTCPFPELFAKIFRVFSEQYKKDASYKKFNKDEPEVERGDSTLIKKIFKVEKPGTDAFIFLEENLYSTQTQNLLLTGILSENQPEEIKDEKH